MTRREANGVYGVDFMTRRLRALFVHDERGRITHCRQGAVADLQWPVPQLHIGRTARGNVWRFSATLDDALVAALEPLAAALPPLGIQANLDLLCQLLAENGPTQPARGGPALCFPEAIPQANSVLIGEENIDLLERYFSDEMESWQLVCPLVASVCDGRAVSLCQSVRIDGGLCEAGLQTAVAYEGEGYGTAAAAGWAAAARDLGLVPLYSTDWENAASRRVAAKLGLVAYGEDLAID